MKFLFTLVASLFFLSLHAQKPVDAAVQLSAIVTNSPAAIQLTWLRDTNAKEYKVFRKALSDKSWQEKATLTAADTTWTDNTVTAGTAYEYQVRRQSTVAGTDITAYGYIYSGIEVPATENRGKIIVIVAENLIGPLSNEIKRLKSDIAADGWQVYSFGVTTAESITSIKTRIDQLYKSDPANFKALLILGHVAVPYSGDLAIDGHTHQGANSHQGAWPADMWYGDIESDWTDDDVLDTLAARKENWNVPGDGKFDLDIIPSDIELQIGRIDLSNLPAFTGLSEIDLMRRYLDKNHAYRTAQFQPKMQAVVEDNFGWVGGEAFGSSAYKNFAPLVGNDKVFTKDWKESLTKDTFIWSYGTGGGNYTGASGIISSTQLAEGSVYNSVFTNLFGSYFGDWDNENNLMRSALASPGMILTCAWSGRPQWLFQHMGLGETIGFSTRLSMNDYTAYFRSTILAPHLRLTTPALMGDPTLRMHMNPMPSNLTVTSTGNGQDLAWTAAPGTVLGYHIYRTTGPTQSWTRLTSTPLTNTSYTDNTPGSFLYMVRALYLQESASGTYYNLSQGVSNPETLPSGIKPEEQPAKHTLFAYPNPSNGIVNIIIPGEGNPRGEISVINPLGAVVYTGMVSEKSMAIDMQNLAKGIYIVRYRNTSAGNVMTVRVVRK